MTEIKHVLVTMHLNEKQREEIESYMPQAEFIYKKMDDVSLAQAQQADIILGSIAPDKIKGSKNLKWLQLSSAGSDRFQNGIIPAGALLTNASGAYGLGIAEYMVGSVLMLMKKLHLYRDNQQKALWQPEGSVVSIYGSKTLVIGLGDIGGEFAKRMKALGSYVVGVRRADIQKPHDADEVYLSEELDKLLPTADIIALCVPDTKETQEILSKDRIAVLKENAVVINVGRGNAINTDALCDAVQTGKIFGAVLDVTNPEPLPKDHRIWHIRNIFITPHISGGFNLHYTKQKVFEIGVENFKAYAKGEKLKNIVDFKIGY